MKKLASLIGIAVLTSATTFAVADSDFCQKKFDGQGLHAHYSQMQVKKDHCDMHKKFMHQGDRHGKHAMMNKNFSPEKRQALMQLRVENKIERMTKKLNLTIEQQAQVRTVLQDAQQKKMQLRQQKRDAINKILTEEQQAKKAHFGRQPKA